MYVQPDMTAWRGRVDAEEGLDARRWHQVIRPLTEGAPPGVVLIGFACDEGVRLNQGRTGSRRGPDAIRRALAGLAYHQTRPLYDAGDVTCDREDLAGAQEALGREIAGLLGSGHSPLVLGGGHEVARGSLLGLAARLWSSEPEARMGIVNCDAHFDLRSAACPSATLAWASPSRATPAPSSTGRPRWA